MLKVSSGSDAKSVAGAISFTVRNAGAPPAILAGGSASINQAIKAIAIARNYLLEEGETEDQQTDLICQPEFDGDSPRVTIRLRKSRPLQDLDASELTVKPDSDPYKVAGAIAGKVRDQERVSITALGPEAVYNTVQAIAVSRTYLADDRIDIKFSPQFIKLDIQGEERSALYFAILSRRLN